MAKVYVAQQPQIKERGGYDISPALQYGEVVFVFESSFKPSADPDNAVEIALSKLADIKKDDYVVWAGGDPLALAIVASIASDLTDGQFKWLRWDRLLDEQGKPVQGRGLYQVIPINVFGE